MSGQATTLLTVYGISLLAAVAGVLRIAGSMRLARGRGLAGGAASGDLISDVLLQRKVVEDPVAGAIHWGIVLSFLALLPRAAEMLLEPFMGADPLFSYSGWWAVYAPLKDVAALLLVVSTGFGLFRRWLIRPRHLQPSLQSQVALSLLGLFALASLLLDGFRAGQIMKIQNLEEWETLLVSYGPAGRFFGSFAMTFWRGETPLVEWQANCYWASTGSLALLLAILPWTRLRHVMLAGQSVRLSRSLPGRALEVESEHRGVPRAGISEVEHLSTKQMLDYWSCMACGRCELQCPTALAGQQLRPARLMQRGLDAVKARSGGKLEKGALLNATGRDAIWDCTFCGACEANCPVSIGQLEKYSGFRRQMAMHEGLMPPWLQEPMNNLQEGRCLAGCEGGQDAQWAAGYPSYSSQGGTEYLLFVGCRSRGGAGAERAASLVRLLGSAGVTVGVLAEEGCCGEPALVTGREDLFQKLAAHNIELFTSKGVTKIVTLCPHGYQTIANVYSQLGLKVEVMHYTALLARLVAEGRLGTLGPLSKRLVVHDSCTMVRNNGDSASVRTVLDAIPESRRVEISLSGINSVCCGGGGGAYFNSASRALLGSQRWTQLSAADADIVVTSCPICREVLGEAEGRERSRATVMDLTEVLTQCVPAGGRERDHTGA